jgi:hypothetical protein
MISGFLADLTSCINDPSTFEKFVAGVKSSLESYTKITETDNDLVNLPAGIQYWMAKKADLEFYKRSLEKQMKTTSIPRLMELVKKGNYISSKLLEAALEGIPEYSQLAEQSSKVQYVLDLIQSGVASMWFKRDALINLSANRRKQFAAEQLEY